MQLAHYLGLLDRAHTELARAFHEVAAGHLDEPDVFHTCERLARQCEEIGHELGPFADRYGQDADDEPDRLHSELFNGTRSGPLGLIRDLHDLYLMACENAISWTVVKQGSQGARDSALLELATRGETMSYGHVAWITTRIKQAAPQALVVA